MVCFCEKFERISIFMMTELDFTTSEEFLLQKVRKRKVVKVIKA